MNKPDHCTGWFEGTWAHCCKKHDDAYAASVDRLLADEALRACVDAAGHPVMALVMFVGVYVFGRFFYGVPQNKN